MILFLDFDGVLHPFPCKGKELLCHVQRLESVLRDFPQVQIVVSSMWRYSHDLASLAGYFSNDMQSRFIGVTPKNKIDGYTVWVVKQRHDEILEWLEQNAYTGPWVALDDSWREFPDPCLQLITCHSEIGFAGIAELQLRDYLTHHLQSYAPDL